MSRTKSKKEIKYLTNIARNHIANKSKYFRRNLHLNHHETDVRIIRIKNSNQFLYEIKGLKELNGLECFFIYHIDSEAINNWMLNIRDSDIVFTDSKTNEVLDKNKKYPDFVNIWILKKNAINYLKIKPGDILFTR